MPPGRTPDTPGDEIRVDRGELTVDVADRVPMADLVSVHARAAAGTLAGKIVVVPSVA
jgi:hypothetical protein